MKRASVIRSLSVVTTKGTDILSLVVALIEADISGSAMLYLVTGTLGSE
jgi:hypothetical protein